MERAHHAATTAPMRSAAEMFKQLAKGNFFIFVISAKQLQPDFEMRETHQRKIHLEQSRKI